MGADIASSSYAFEVIVHSCNFESMNYRRQAVCQMRTVPLTQSRNEQVKREASGLILLPSRDRH